MLMFARIGARRAFATASRLYPDAPRVGVAVTAFAPGDDESRRVLLCQRGKEPSKGMWTLPGGVLEIGEAVEACAVREFAEETGLGLLLPVLAPGAATRNGGTPGMPRGAYATSQAVFHDDDRPSVSGGGDASAGGGADDAAGAGAGAGVAYHYVLTHVLGRADGTRAIAQDDVDDVRWFDVDAVVGGTAGVPLTPTTGDVVARAAQLLALGVFELPDA